MHWAMGRQSDCGSMSGLSQRHDSTASGIPGGNKRCHKLSTETLPKPFPERSNAVFIGLRAVSGGREVTVKKINSIYAPTGCDEPFSGGPGVAIEPSWNSIFRHLSADEP